MLIVGTRAAVQPFIAFGERLLSAGYSVQLATQEKFHLFVREHQLEFRPIASNPDGLMSFVVKKKRRDITAILASTGKACIEPDDGTSVPFHAEVIIVNSPSCEHMHCAQKLKIPLGMILTTPWSATITSRHAFCNIDYFKASCEKLNLLSYSTIEFTVRSS